MESKQMSKFKIKTGIMASSSLQMAIVGVAPAIPLMLQNFPDANPTTVMSVVTIPSLVYIPISLIIGALTSKIGKKIPLLIGIIIIGLSGLIPALFNVSLTALLLSCVGIGIGNGFLIPTCTGLIPDHFQGLEQGDVMGKQSAFINLGAMVLSMLGGYLAVSNWNNAFYIYLYTIPIFLITMLCVPKDEKQVTKAGSAQKIKLSKEVYVMAGLIFVYGLCFGVLNTNNAILVAEKGLGDASTAGLAGSLMSGIGILVGIFYGKIFGVLKEKTLPISIIIVSLGMFLMGFAFSPMVLYLGSMACGIGFSMLMPTGLFRSAQSVGPESSTIAITIYLSAINIALFLCPLITNPLSQILSNGSAQSRYYMGAVVLIGLFIFAFFYIRNPKQQTIKG